MPITPKQRERRRKHIGSSDVAPILNASKWKKPIDIWLEKTGKLVEVEEVDDNDAKYAGTMFEHPVLRWSETLLGSMMKNQFRVFKPAYLGVSTDAIVKATGNPVDAKTAGLFGPLDRAWGEDGSDQIPDEIIIQCHAHLLATDKPICHVPAFLGGRGFCLFEVPRNTDLVEAIWECCVGFWENHVLRDVPPPDSVPTLDIMKRVRRVPSKSVTIDAKLLDAYLGYSESLKHYTEMVDSSKAAILNALGDGEEATFEGRPEVIRYMETKRKSYTVPEGTYRRWQLLKGKS